MNWLARLLGRGPSSAEIAKSRLKLVLSYDRTNLTPEMLTTLQEELVQVLSKHLDIDRAKMTVSTQRGDGGDHLIADIPIKSLRRPSAPEPASPELGAQPQPAPQPATRNVPSYKKKKRR
jgi:cell division topological specificity factor